MSAFWISQIRMPLENAFFFLLRKAYTLDQQLQATHQRLLTNRCWSFMSPTSTPPPRPPLPPAT